LYRCSLFILLCGSRLLAQSVSPERLYNEAVTLSEKGDLPGAISKYQEFLKLQPESLQARSNLAVALARLGRYDEAIANYLLALRRDSENLTVRLNLAIARYKQANFEEAARELEEVRNRSRENRQAVSLLADCYLRLDRNKEAIALVEGMYAADPGDKALAYILGTALIRDGQIPRGQIVINQILARGDSAEASLLLGASQLAAGERKEALASLRKAIDLNPKLPGIWSLYGRAQMENEDNEGARASFRKALEADSTDFEANLHLGALLRHDNDQEAAAVCLARALRLRPSSLAARFQMGAVNAARGRLEEALDDLESVARQAPDFQEVHVQLASLYYRLNRKEDGQREREIVLQLDAKERQRRSEAQAKP
jgi:tetratricopeptide (TPR) repeat protein